MEEFRKEMDLSYFSLDELKAYKKREIDNRTEKLIAAGYTYATKVFSLSSNAQTNLIGLDNVMTELTYPITYSTLDDLDSYDVVDATDMHNMYLTALTTKKGHLDSGRTLKESVNAAVDIAAVNAVVDAR
jgi:hypothetical protein